MSLYDCPECGWVNHHDPDCKIYQEVCGYFTHCEAYQQNLTCEHNGAPAYIKREGK